MDWTQSSAPDLADIDALAHASRDALPLAFRGPAQAVRLRVEDIAPDDVLRDLGIEDPFELTGLYEGVPLTQKSQAEPDIGPDTIWLFRRAILDEWSARGDVPLGALVAHVLVHELAHHFGWSDEDIAQIDQWWV